MLSQWTSWTGWAWGRLPILRFLRENPPHAAAWVGLVTFVARDQVDMRVVDGLAGGGAVIESDIKAGGLMALLKKVAHGGDGSPKGSLCFRREFIKAGSDRLGNNERVAGRDRIAIVEGNSVGVLVDDAFRLKRRERRVGKDEGRRMRDERVLHGYSFNCLAIDEAVRICI
jgi:hypothetical protein